MSIPWASHVHHMDIPCGHPMGHHSTSTCYPSDTRGTPIGCSCNTDRMLMDYPCDVLGMPMVYPWGCPMGCACSTDDLHMVYSCGTPMGHTWAINKLPMGTHGHPIGSPRAGSQWVAHKYPVGRPCVDHAWLYHGHLMGIPWVSRGYPMGHQRRSWVTHVLLPSATHALTVDSHE